MVNAKISNSKIIKHQMSLDCLLSYKMLSHSINWHINVFHNFRHTKTLLLWQIKNLIQTKNKSKDSETSIWVIMNFTKQFLLIPGHKSYKESSQPHHQNNSTLMCLNKLVNTNKSGSNTTGQNLKVIFGKQQQLQRQSLFATIL